MKRVRAGASKGVRQFYRGEGRRFLDKILSMIQGAECDVSSFCEVLKTRKNCSQIVSK